MRKNVNDFPGGLREALQQNIPCYIPAGQVIYLKESEGIISVDACPDIVGEDGTEIRVRGAPLKGGNGRLKLGTIKVTGATTTDCLLDYSVTTGEVPGFDMDGVDSSLVQLVRVQDYLDQRNLTLHNVTMIDITNRGGSKAPIDLQGAIRYHALEHILIEDYKERGLVIGSGRRSGQLRMEKGFMFDFTARRCTPNGSASNNFAFWHGGRNVEIENVEIEDFPSVLKPNGQPHTDTEAAYTKVDSLRALDWRFLRCNGNLGIWSNKGAHPVSETWEIDGRDTVAENFLIDSSGIAGPKTALWLQCYGPCIHAKFKVIGCSGVWYRMHQNCNGDYTMREWDVRDQGFGGNPAGVYRAGSGSLHVEDSIFPVADSSSLWYRESPAGLVFTETRNRRTLP